MRMLSLTVCMVSAVMKLVACESDPKEAFLERNVKASSCSYMSQNMGGEWGANPGLLILRTNASSVGQCCVLCDDATGCTRGFFYDNTCWLLRSGSGLALLSELGVTYFGQPITTTPAPISSTTAPTCNCGNQNVHLDYANSPVPIYSPNYPSNYPNNCNCVWYLSTHTGYDVAISVAAFQSESCCDALTVYDGSSAAGDVIEICRGATCHNATSTGPYMTLVFTTDSSVTASGFLLYARAIIPTMSTTTSAPFTTTQTEDACVPIPGRNYWIQPRCNNALAVEVQGGSLADGAYVVTSPYSGLLYQKWTFQRVQSNLYSVLNSQSGSRLYLYQGSCVGFSAVGIVQLRSVGANNMGVWAVTSLGNGYCSFIDDCNLQPNPPNSNLTMGYFTGCNSNQLLYVSNYNNSISAQFRLIPV